MGSKKYSGYKSFQYLEAGTDYILPPLERQINRFPRYDFGLSKTQEEHVQEIIEKNIMISLQDSLMLFPEKGYKGPLPKNDRRFTAYEAIAYAGLDCVCEGVWDSTWPTFMTELGMRFSDYAHQDFVIPCLKSEDVERAFREGKCAILTDLGHADGMENDVDRIEIFQGLGIRRMGIVYSGSNALGGGSYEIKDGGLTNLGYDAVMRMNKVGMLIDVSHAGDVTAMETIQASKDPVCISHRGSRNLNTVMPKRMAPDEVLQACAEKGGVVGVVVAGYGLRTKKHPDGSIEGFLEHMGHLIDILGIDHVGAGPDTIYTDHAEYYRNKAREQAKGGVGHYSRAEATDMWSELGSIVAGFDYVKGLESVTDFPNIIRGLVRDGYSDGEIAKVAGRNALRLLRKYSKLNDDWQLEFVRVLLRPTEFK